MTMKLAAISEPHKGIKVLCRLRLEALAESSNITFADLSQNECTYSLCTSIACAYHD